MNAGPALPPFYREPQLATATDRAPAGDGWLHEIKYDGYRLTCVVSDGTARLVTRGGKDWTEQFLPVAEAVAFLGVTDAVFDGEVAVVRPDGRTSFQDLQNHLGGQTGGVLRYFAFDLLHLDGEDLCPLPLEERKVRLKDVLARLPPDTIWRFGDHILGRGPEFFRQACEHSLEGIVSKRRTAPYRTGRSRDWLKVKCSVEDDFVVIGYTEPGGSREGFGALLLARPDGEGGLAFAGRVGTGFTGRRIASLMTRLVEIGRDDPACSGAPAGRAAREMHWVEPSLIARVAFTGWTSDRVLRHASFKGLREDVDASAIAASDGPGAGEAVPASLPARRRRSGSSVANVSLTNPAKVLFPGSGVTKLEVAEYYEAAAEVMLPCIARRPLTLVRCPAGISDCFYQKQIEAGMPASVLRVPIPDDGGSVDYGAVDSVDGLVSLVQLGVLEFHTWGSRVEAIDRPDRFTIDLDPDPSVPWVRVLEAAVRVRNFLLDIGFQSFVKTTGGKGLHVVVPVEPERGWDEVKEFSRGVAAGVAAAQPGRYTLNVSKASRRGRILIDYLRNGRGATAVEAWSTRARPGAPVSVPIWWEELAEGVRSDQFNVRNVAERISSVGARPWEDYAGTRQSITDEMLERVSAG